MRSLLMVAWRTLRRASLRSALAALGIVIGVAAVVAMVALGEGARASIEASLSNVDASKLTVNARMPRQPPFGIRPDGVPRNERLTVEDARAIGHALGADARVGVQLMLANSQLKSRARSTSARLNGIEADGLVFESRKVTRGTMFGRADVQGARPVCLITRFLAGLLFPGEEAVGQSVLIGEVPFKVLGVVNDSGIYGDPSRTDLGDATVIVPYTSLWRRLDRDALLTIVVRAANPLLLAAAQTRTEQVLEQRRGARRSEFITANYGSVVDAYKAGSRTMSLLLGAIACISLIVGGIGIMNIMLISVLERTREIGIRLAVGTLAGDVLLQFLLESIVLCMVGGAIGVVVGVSAAHVLSVLNGWPTLITFNSILIALLVSAGVGIAFGYFPARRAADLPPIRALRVD